MNKLFLLAALAMIIACNNKDKTADVSPLVGIWTTLEVTADDHIIQREDRDSAIAAGFAAIKKKYIERGEEFTTADSTEAMNEAEGSFDQLFNIRYDLQKDSGFLLKMIFNTDTIETKGRWLTDAGMKTFLVILDKSQGDTVKTELQVDGERITFIHNDSMKHTMIRVKE